VDNQTAVTDRSIAAAYSTGAMAWRAGPARIYGRLAEVLVDGSPIEVAGRSVLDVGAGTGAASQAARRARAATVVAVDVALGMLAVDADRRPPAVAADAVALPFRDDSFDVAVAAFSLNHLADPVAGLREAARVTRTGGAVLAASYADDDTHPVKAAVESSLVGYGWSAPAWQQVMHRERAPLLADERGCEAALAKAGLDGSASRVRVSFVDLRPRDLVAWRMGMAQYAAFVATLAPDRRDAIESDALARLGDAPPLVRSVMVMRGRP
jgi:ubiquinone/menaquinone biosynthesis C-methylase UbiE